MLRLRIGFRPPLYLISTLRYRSLRGRFLADLVGLVEDLAQSLRFRFARPFSHGRIQRRSWAEWEVGSSEDLSARLNAPSGV